MYLKGAPSLAFAMRRPGIEADEASQRAVEALRVELGRRVGAHLTRLRAARRWSQEEAAWRSNLALRAYQRLESGGDGNPTIVTLARLSVAFEVGVCDLLEPAPTPPPRRPGRPKADPDARPPHAVSEDAPEAPPADQAAGSTRPTTSE